MKKDIKIKENVTINILFPEFGLTLIDVPVNKLKEKKTIDKDNIYSGFLKYLEKKI